MVPARPSSTARPPEVAPTASGRLTALRRRIAVLERRSSAAGPACAAALRRPWRLGVAVLDAALPADAPPGPESGVLRFGGLAPSGVHEAAGASGEDRPAALAFLAALLVRLGHAGRRGPVAVCQSPGSRAGRPGRLYGPGWRDLGLDPADLLVVETRREREALWAMEECLRSGALAAVLGETEGPDFTASRRLALAAREGGTPLLLLRGDGLDGTSAAATRWQVAAMPPDQAPAQRPGQAGRTDLFDEAAPGPPRWRLELRRCRGGRPATCIVEWNRETADFHMAAALADRPAAPRARRRAAPQPALARAAG